MVLKVCTSISTKYLVGSRVSGVQYVLHRARAQSVDVGLMQCTLGSWIIRRPSLSRLLFYCVGGWWGFFHCFRLFFGGGGGNNDSLGIDGWMDGWWIVPLPPSPPLPHHEPSTQHPHLHILPRFTPCSSSAATHVMKTYTNSKKKKKKKKYNWSVIILIIG